MFGLRRTTLFTAGLMALGAFTAACSNAGATSPAGSGGPAIHVGFPVSGAHVSEPFTLRIETSVPLGDPSTGDNHVHVCFDGQSCDLERNLLFGTMCVVTGLAPGRHTIEASLRNADHSDAGPNDTVTVNVMPGSSRGTGMGSCAAAGATGAPSGGYGY